MSEGDDHINIHPRYTVKVTEAHNPWEAAYVGQALMGIDGVIYGGTLCSVRRLDPATANATAQHIADAWNATAQLRDTQGATQ